MNSLLARTALLGLSMYASVAAALPFASLDTIKADFIAQDSLRYESATATVDYAKDTMELVLKPVCQAGDTCEANEPAVATYRFERVTSTADRCGVVKSVAVKDYTAVDGTRTQVTIIDASRDTCHEPKAIVASLSFDQKWYDRINGKWIQIRDRFTAEAVETMVAFQGVIRAELSSLTSQAFKDGSIFFDGRQRKLELTVNPICPQGADCSQEKPEAVIYEFNNALTQIDSCGIIRTVASFDGRPYDGIFMKVTLSNNRNNVCPTFAPLNPLDVIVERAYYSRLEGRAVETWDYLKADDFAWIKPAK